MNANGTRLSALTKDLCGHWQQTKDYWRDVKAQEFERKYIDELVANVDRALIAIEQLEKLTDKIKKDCE